MFTPKIALSLSRNTSLPSKDEPPTTPLLVCPQTLLQTFLLSYKSCNLYKIG